MAPFDKEGQKPSKTTVVSTRCNRTSLSRTLMCSKLSSWEGNAKVVDSTVLDEFCFDFVLVNAQALQVIDWKLSELKSELKPALTR